MLVKDGVLSRVSKGVFNVGENRSYHPVVDAKLKKLAKTIGKQFPFAEFCLWDTAFINEMSGSVYDSFHYREILKHLQKEAKRLDCDISELTYDYSKPSYDIKC